MFSIPGVVSQRHIAENITNYVDTILNDDPAIFLYISENTLVVNDDWSYPSGYPILVGENIQYGPSIVRGFQQSLKNTSNSLASDTASCIKLQATAIAKTEFQFEGTMEAWVFFDNVAKNSTRPLSLCDNTYFFINGGTSTHDVRIKDANMVTGSFSYTFATNTIYHIVFTWGNNVAIVYINGQVALNSAYSIGRDINYNAGSFILGSNRGGAGRNCIYGSQQCTAIYRYPLTSTQVTAHYNAGVIV